MAKLEMKDLVELSESQKSFAPAADAVKAAMKSAGDTVADAEKAVSSL